MTQAEIFQNMTPQKQWNVETRSDEDIFHFEMKEERPYNLLAKSSAIRNTYGKGINPESVGEMRDLLEYLLEWADETRQLRIREALTAAKL